jgi:thymidylate synthase
MYQRSTDWFLGVPWNITSYAFLLLIVIELINNSPLYTGTKLVPHKLLMSFGDIHLYNNSIESAKKQIKRIPIEFPTIEFTKTIKSLEELKWCNIKINNYKFSPNDFNVEMMA